MGSARGRSLRRRRGEGGGGGGGGLAIYTPAGQPVTVGFQSFQEAEWVSGTVRGHGPPLDFPSPGFAPFSSTRRAAPGSGTPCPRSSLRKQIQASRALLELSVCPGSLGKFFEDRRLSVGPHPHPWPSSRTLNFPSAPRLVEGLRGVSAPPSPSSGFRRETVCTASERPPPPPPPSPGPGSPRQKPGTAPRPSSEPGGGREAGAGTEKATPRAICGEE